MENQCKIRNLKDLLGQFFGGTVTIKQCTITPLTAAGENYGSQMLSAEINCAINKEEISLNLVAKMCPPNEWIKKMFHTAITFKKEIAMYNVIFPTLKALQKEQEVPDVISFVPECYGARTSLDPQSTIVDDDAVLLLENLKLSGYTTVDRMKGFDLETTKLLLKDLAIFHAVPIALKLLKPNIFFQQILPHLNSLQAFDNLPDNIIKSMIEMMVNAAKMSKECVPLIPKVVEALKGSLNNLNNRQAPCEPFATIVHNDYWVNNSMIKYENNRPIQNKMIDFQLIDYGSPGNDLVFFLFSSVQKNVLDVHYDNLLKLYYDTFIGILNDLKCDTRCFTFELLLKEIDISAKTTQFFHVMDMLVPICAKKGKVKELSEMTEEDLIKEDQLSDLYKQRVPETILQFAKRKWI